MKNYYLINHTRKEISYLIHHNYMMTINNNYRWQVNDKYEIFIMGYGNDYYPTYLLTEEGYLSGCADHFLSSESEWKAFNSWHY